MDNYTIPMAIIATTTDVFNWPSPREAIACSHQCTGEGHSHERQLAGAGQRQSKGRQITRRLPDDSPVLLARVAQSVERVFEKHETVVRLHSPIANQKGSWGINVERRQADLPKPNEWLLRNIGFCPGRWTGVQTHVPHETNHNQRSSPEGVSGNLEIMGVDAHGKQRHGGANQCPRSPPYGALHSGCGTIDEYSEGKQEPDKVINVSDRRADYQKANQDRKFRRI